MSSLNTDELISLVRKKPQLWDRGNRFHSNRHILDKCWKKIASELNADENKIRKKWKYLRDQFSVEFGKIPPADCKDDVLIYEPKWKYYKPLQFLEEVVTPRINTKNLRRDDDTTDSEVSSELRSPSPAENGVKNTRYKQRTQASKKNTLRHLQQKNKMKRLSNTVNEEHLHFFKSLLPHVRTIPPHLQLSFRNRVQEVVEEFAYRPDPTAATNVDKSNFPPNEPYFITCVPDHAAKFEPPESVDESQDNQDDDGLS